MTDLPEGLTRRPLTAEDAAAVYETMAEQERHDTGRAEIEPADIVADWQVPGFDVPASTVGVFDGDRMVGYAEVGMHDRGDAAVLPAYRRRGIGTWLAGWMRRNARERGRSVIGAPVPEGSDGDRLLAALGYDVRWTSWVLRLPPGAVIVDRPVPEGWSVRAAGSAEQVEVHGVLEDAFLEWSEREREPFEAFRAGVLARPGFEPWQLRVVVEPAGAVAGVAVLQMAEVEDDGPEAYIARLAVRRELRGRGLAQALMADAFAQARAHGATSSCLSTDSRTGALGLYEKVGMRVESVWVNRAVRLDRPPPTEP